MPNVLTGLDRFVAGDRAVHGLLRGRRVGLLAHAASVDGSLRHVLPLLRAADCAPVALFGPEHGFEGTAQDMVGVGDATADGQVPVYSLYGDSEDALSPTPAQLRGLDVLLIDLQDVGSRYYTYVWTAVRAFRAAAAQGVHTVVLDRPNPLGGVVLEGAPQRPGYQSFVGLCDVPVRHGMTLGEMCGRVARLEGLPEGALSVIAMQGWSRDMLWPDTGLPWVMPSPNMPTPDTALVYPGGCLLEGTNLSEGRGTTRPFEIFGAPFLRGAQLAAAVAEVATAAGAALRPLGLEPTFHKHAGQHCGGVQVHVVQPRALRSYALYLHILAACRALAPTEFAWRREPYEFVADRPAIDLLTGGPEFRELVDAGDPPDDYLRAQQRGVEAFGAERAADLQY